MGDLLSLTKIKSTSRPRRSNKSVPSIHVVRDTTTRMPIIEKALEEKITRLKDKLGYQTVIYERAVDDIERLHDGIIRTKKELDATVEEQRIFNRMKFYESGH